MDGFQDQIDSLVDSLNTGKGSVGQLINDPALYNKAVQAVDQLSKMSADLSAGKGTIGKLLTDDTLYNHVNDTTARLDHITAEIDSGQGSIGKLLKDKGVDVQLGVGVTAVRRDGREVVFTVHPERLVATASWMTSVAASWQERLQLLKRAAEVGDRPAEAGDYRTRPGDRPDPA